MRIFIEAEGHKIDISGLQPENVMEHLEAQNSSVGQRCAVLEEEKALLTEKNAKKRKRIKRLTDRVVQLEEENKILDQRRTAEEEASEASKWKAETAKWQGIAQGREKRIIELEEESTALKKTLEIIHEDHYDVRTETYHGKRGYPTARQVNYNPKTNTYSHTKGIGNRTGEDDVKGEDDPNGE